MLDTKNLPESRLRILRPHLGNEPLLNAINRHQERHPERWATDDDWANGIAKIAAGFRELDEYEDRQRKWGPEKYEQRTLTKRKARAVIAQYATSRASLDRIESAIVEARERLES